MTEQDLEKSKVLILILLEVGLLDSLVDFKKEYKSSCLNPYSTGSWVAGSYATTLPKLGKVLILILLEVGLLVNVPCLATGVVKS